MNNEVSVNDNLVKDEFVPRSWARNPHVQSFLGNLKMRSRSLNPMIDFTRKMIIDGKDGVRLLGYHSWQPSNSSRGLITLIHGWEGSSHSTYILSTAKYLYDIGYNIFRLNLRDHGNSHHLNNGLFHGALIEETFQAVRNIAGLSNEKPYYVIGFSLGGNFALRVALKHTLTKIPNLKHVISISPALDPYKATLAIDENFSIYRYYFLKKWKNSLRKKQVLFPEKYDFAGILGLNTCMALTEAIMPYYPEFRNYREYFNQYTLLNNAFDGLSIPTTIIAAEDDPLLPIQDIYGLKENGYLRLSVQRYGGHCGFIDFPPFTCWYEAKIEQTLSQREGI